MIVCPWGLETDGHSNDKVKYDVTDDEVEINNITYMNYKEHDALIMICYFTFDKFLIPPYWLNR